MLKPETVESLRLIMSRITARRGRPTDDHDVLGLLAGIVTALEEIAEAEGAQMVRMSHPIPILEEPAHMHEAPEDPKTTAHRILAEHFPWMESAAGRDEMGGCRALAAIAAAILKERERCADHIRAVEAAVKQGHPVYVVKGRLVD